MIYIRANMIGGLGWSLAKAVTISTRYLHIRRQVSSSVSEGWVRGSVGRSCLTGLVFSFRIRS